MRPVRLEFEGIKSYTAKTVIDFDKLLKEGIFGIFGNTGSGKSTILDALLLALYGRTSQTSSSVDFVSYTKDRAYVDYTFAMRDGATENVYRCFHEFKIKTPPRKAGTHKAIITKFINGEEQPLAEGVDQVNVKIKEIIGLSFEEFLKCIILPQGKFQNFVCQTKGERIKLMASLFGLEKYGEKLYRKVKDDVLEKSGQLDSLNGTLSYFDDCDQLQIDSVKNQLSSAQSELANQIVIFSKIKDEFKNFERNYETHKKLLECEKSLAELQQILPAMETKKQYLAKFQIAKNCVKSFDEITRIEEKVASYKQRKLSLNQEKVELEKTFEERRKSFVDNGELERSIGAVTNKITLIESLSLDINLRDAKQVELSTLRQECKKYLDEKNVLLKQYEVLKAEQAKHDEYACSLNPKGKVDLILQQIEFAVGNNVVLEEVDFLQGITTHLDQVGLSAVLERISVLKSLLDNNGCDCDLRALISNLQICYEQIDQINEKSHKIESQIKSNLHQTELLCQKIEQVTENGKKVKADFDIINEKIEKICLGKNYNDVLNFAVQEKQKLLKVKQEQESFAKQIEERLAKISADLISTNASLSENLQQLQQKQAEYNAMIVQNFSGAEECNRIVASIDSFEVVSQQVEKFFNRLFAVEQQVEELRAQTTIVVTDEIYAKKKAEFAEFELLVNNLDKNIEKLKETHKNLSQKFEKRCIIVKQIEEVKQKYNLLYSLLDVVKGSNLVNFIADEYLKEIAAMAKVTLLTLTDGKFGLCYQDDFWIEDNVLGGEKRRVDTVSGGELFLVSLSLALALSRSIYAKSQRPIEFFFLDEGFGSLDKELVETVIDSLQKLRNEKLTIGVISHVETLKDRISAKIIVSGATEIKGSTITID